MLVFSLGVAYSLILGDYSYSIHPFNYGHRCYQLAISNKQNKTHIKWKINNSREIITSHSHVA